MAILKFTMLYDTEDNEGFEGGPCYHRNTEIKVNIKADDTIDELHRAYAAFLKVLGYSTEAIDELCT